MSTKLANRRIDGKTIISGQLDGIDGSTVSIDELMRLVKQAGYHLMLHDPQDLVKQSLLPSFKSTCWDRMEAIWEQCVDRNRTKYDNYHKALERLDAFLKEHLSEEDYKAFFKLYVELEESCINPWEIVHKESLYFFGLRDGMAVGEFLAAGGTP